MLPNLRIAKLKKLVAHESADPARIRSLIRKFRLSKVFTNPILVAILLNKNKYLVLDGANRLSVAERLSIPDILVQVINYNNPQVKLENWSHLILGDDWKKWWPRIIKMFRDIIVTLPSSYRINPWHSNNFIAYIKSPANRIYGIKAGQTESFNLQLLNKIVNTYISKYRVIRLMENKSPLVSNTGQLMTALIKFPRFSKHDIKRFTSKGLIIPSGISRHTVPSRALRVNVPFTILRSTKTSQWKNNWLKRHIKDLNNQGRIRCYHDPACLYDE